MPRSEHGAALQPHSPWPTLPRFVAIFCRKLAAMPALTTDRDGPLQMLAEEVSLRRNQCAEELLRGFHQTSEPVRGALKAIVSSMDPVGPGHTALQAAVGLGKSGTQGPVCRRSGRRGR